MSDKLEGSPSQLGKAESTDSDVDNLHLEELQITPKDGNETGSETDCSKDNPAPELETTDAQDSEIAPKIKPEITKAQYYEAMLAAEARFKGGEYYKDVFRYKDIRAVKPPRCTCRSVAKAVVKDGPAVKTEGKDAVVVKAEIGGSQVLTEDLSVKPKIKVPLASNVESVPPISDVESVLVISDEDKDAPEIASCQDLKKQSVKSKIKVPDISGKESDCLSEMKQIRPLKELGENKVIENPEDQEISEDHASGYSATAYTEYNYSAISDKVVYETLNEIDERDTPLTEEQVDGIRIMKKLLKDCASSEDTDEPDDPSVPERIAKFYSSRKRRIQRLLNELVTVLALMDEGNKERHDFKDDCKHDFSICRNVPALWTSLIKLWDDIYNSIDRLITETKNILKRIDEKRLTSIKEFNAYIDMLMLTCEDTEELFILCGDAWKTHLHVCFRFDDYMFLCYFRGMKSKLEPLINKLFKESEKYNLFEESLRKEDGEYVSEDSNSCEH